MVHVRKCSLGRRGKSTTEFYKGDKPQIYCRGWVDLHNDEPLPECKACADWVHGEQCEKDYEEWKKGVEE